MLLSGGLLRLSISADTNGNLMDCEVPYSALQSYKIFFIKRNSHSGLTLPNRRGYRQPDAEKGRYPRWVSPLYEIYEKNLDQS